MRETWRRYRLPDVPLHKVPMGGNGYLFLVPYDSLATRQAPNDTRYLERSLGMGITVAVEQDGVWAVWAPGWGVDIHWPANKGPAYLQGISDNECEYVGGACKCDGSSLADGEQFWPAFREGGVEAVLALLRKWLSEK